MSIAVVDSFAARVGARVPQLQASSARALCPSPCVLFGSNFVCAGPFPWDLVHYDKVMYLALMAPALLRVRTAVCMLYLVRFLWGWYAKGSRRAARGNKSSRGDSPFLFLVSNLKFEQLFVRTCDLPKIKYIPFIHTPMAVRIASKRQLVDHQRVSVSMR